MVPSEKLSDIEAETGATVVDPTNDQFSLSNRRKRITEVGLGREENLPAVGIYPPGSEERQAWYSRK
jgi:hypothetical protein